VPRAILNNRVNRGISAAVVPVAEARDSNQPIIYLADPTHRILAVRRDRPSLARVGRNEIEPSAELTPIDSDQPTITDTHDET
jgi:hypothetical protein